MIRTTIALAIAAFTALQAHAQQAQDDFVHKPLAEIMQGATATDGKADQYPLYFTIPNRFVTYYGGAKVGILLATQEDINAMTKSGSIRDTKSGFFRIAAAPAAEYDRATGKFSDENDPALKDKLAAAGLEDCSFRRVDANGVPMLASACSKGGRHAYMLHIAGTRPQETALKVFYFHPPVHTQRDEAIWSHFIAGLSGKD